MGWDSRCSNIPKSIPGAGNAGGDFDVINFDVTNWSTFAMFGRWPTHRTATAMLTDSWMFVGGFSVLIKGPAIPTQLKNPKL